MGGAIKFFSFQQNEIFFFLWGAVAPQATMKIRHCIYTHTPIRPSIKAIESIKHSIALLFKSSLDQFLKHCFQQFISCGMRDISEKAALHCASKSVAGKRQVHYVHFISNAQSLFPFLFFFFSCFLFLFLLLSPKNFNLEESL